MTLDRIYHDKIKGCLNIVKNNYGNILDIPDKCNILFNIEHINEYMKRDYVALTTYNTQHKHIKHIISFNRKYFKPKNEFDILNIIIPHELAHVICFHNNIIEPEHGHTWRGLCLMMGGTGDILVS